MTNPAAGVEPAVPSLRAEGDLGYGYRAVFEYPNRQVFLEAHGAQVDTSNSGDTVRITLRSNRRDFEGDRLYLLLSEMAVGKVTWIGGSVVLDGVLVEHLWRTEDDVTAALAADPTGQAGYAPPGPLPNPDGALSGTPYRMLRCRVVLHQRAPLAADGTADRG